jgi:hypothetical protein
MDMREKTQASEEEISSNKTREENRRTFYKRLCAMKYRCILYIASIITVSGYFINAIVTDYLKNSILKRMSENNSDSLRMLVGITSRLLENNSLPEKNQYLSN